MRLSLGGNTPILNWGWSESETAKKRFKAAVRSRNAQAFYIELNRSPQRVLKPEASNRGLLQGFLWAASQQVSRDGLVQHPIYIIYKSTWVCPTSTLVLIIK
jgi:hypothetical protein